MNYTPDTQPLPPSATGLSLYVDTFEDARGAKAPEVVGDVHTTLFNVRQPAILEGGVVDITTEAFQEAFKAAGFNVVEDDGCNPPSARLSKIGLSTTKHLLHNQCSTCKTKKPS